MCITICVAGYGGGMEVIMINKISESVTTKLMKSNIIKDEDFELYQFGIESFLMKAIHLISYLLIGVIFGRILELVVFLIALIPLRECSGGYHARTPLRCYIISCSTIFTFLCLLSFLPDAKLLFTIILALVTSFILFFIVPVETENKPLSDTEITHYRRKARFLIVIELSLAFVFYMVSWYVWSFIMTLSLSYELFIAIAGILAKKASKDNNTGN